MANTYCGKDCELCSRKISLECQGCKLGPGKSWGGECEIATCCRDKGHESCDTCTNNRYCGKRTRREKMPEYRDKKRAEEERKQAEIAARAPVLGKWLWILFWLIVPSAVAAILSIDSLAALAPGVYRFGKILSVLCSAAYGVILLKLSGYSPRYHTAGVCKLVAAAGSLIIALVSGGGTVPTWTLIISLPMVVVGLVALYQEYTGHSQVLEGVDAWEAQKWCDLWKWTIITYLVMIGSVVVMAISPLLGLLVMVAALLGLLITSIMSLVYLYRTANIFRNYSPN